MICQTLSVNKSAIALSGTQLLLSGHEQREMEDTH